MPRRFLLPVLVAVSLCAACGDPGGGSPLGGPYGGTGGYVPPGDPDAQAEDPDGGAPPEDSGGPSAEGGEEGGSPPATWTEIYDRYVASGSVGDCGGCHGLSSSAAAYEFLKNQGQISGTSSAIVTRDSEFSWFGGFMPPGGRSSDPAAVADMKAWVAAGALEN